MAVGIAQSTALLGALPGTLYVQPHSGDPGPAGVLNTIFGATRGTVTLPTASGGQRADDEYVDCPGIPAGASVSHVSYWDAASGGTFRFSVPLGVSVSFLYAGRLRLLSQVFTVQTDTGGSQTQTSVNSDLVLLADAATGRLVVLVADATNSSDTAGAFTGSGANDTSSASDAVAIQLGVVVVDSTAQSDTAAAGGVVSDVVDTTTASDSHGLSQVFLSATSDTGTVSDSAGASEGGGSLPAPDPMVIRYAPDAVLSKTGNSGATSNVAWVQDDPDSPNADWFAALSNNTATDARVSFPTPVGTGSTGTQEFRALVRKFSATQTGTPTARVELWASGVLVRAGSDVGVTDAAGQVIAFTWDPSEVADPASVECKVVGTPSGGATGERNAVDIGAVEWNAQVAGIALVDEFDGASLDAGTWGFTAGGGISAAVGSGLLNLSRPAGSAAGFATVASVASFAAGVGRQVKFGDVSFPAGSGLSAHAVLRGSAYEYEVTAYTYQVGEDGEGYPIYGRAARVEKRNVSTDAIVASTTLEPGMAGTWTGGFAQLELLYTGGSTVEVRGDGVLLGTATLSDLASFSVAFRMRATLTTSGSATCGRIEVGVV